MNFDIHDGYCGVVSTSIITIIGVFGSYSNDRVWLLNLVFEFDVRTRLSSILVGEFFGYRGF